MALSDYLLLSVLFFNWSNVKRHINIHQESLTLTLGSDESPKMSHLAVCFPVPGESAHRFHQISQNFHSPKKSQNPLRRSSDKECSKWVHSVLLLKIIFIFNFYLHIIHIPFPKWEVGLFYLGCLFVICLQISFGGHRENYEKL
jgi:hypothetical protein